MRDCAPFPFQILLGSCPVQESLVTLRLPVGRQRSAYDPGFTSGTREGGVEGDRPRPLLLESGVGGEPRLSHRLPQRRLQQALRPRPLPLRLRRQRRHPPQQRLHPGHDGLLFGEGDIS